MITETKANEMINHFAKESPKYLLNLKHILTDDGAEFDHTLINTAIRRYQHDMATERDRRRDVYLKCLNSGHIWRVRSQAAWDNGWDEPVICQRCGAWDM
jgi:hypothetical protein